MLFLSLSGDLASTAVVADAVPPNLTLNREGWQGSTFMSAFGFHSTYTVTGHAFQSSSSKLLNTTVNYIEPRREQESDSTSHDSLY
jgi:hypothetical protein